MSLASVQPEVSYNLNAVHLARYILALDAARPTPDVSQLKLNKLLYLAQANYLAATGHRLFDEQVEAYEHGPVVPSLLQEYGHCGKDAIISRAEPASAPELPTDVRDFLDQLWGRYKHWSASRLWRLTHDQRPWQESYHEGSFHAEIPDRLMKDFFRFEVPADQRVLHPDTVVVDVDLLDDLERDEDEIVARAARALA